MALVHAQIFVPFVTNYDIISQCHVIFFLEELAKRCANSGTRRNVRLCTCNLCSVQ